MGKTPFKSFCSTFLNPMSVLNLILLTAIACVFSSIINTGHAKADSRITLLSTTITSADDSEHRGEWQTVRMRVTAYCPCPKCCGIQSKGKTASGHKINPGDTLAAADKEYPFGTEMVIPGYNNEKPVEVLDRGGLIRGDRLDVFFDSHKAAQQWGVRYLDVKIRHK